MRLAVDATSLIGDRTGIGTFTAEVLARLPRPDLEVAAFAVTRRGASALMDQLPPGVDARRRPMVARPLRMAWRRFDRPVIEHWTGPTDVVWGPNFVVPPTKSAAEVVTVHDLTCIHFPEMCTSDTLQVPGLLRRAIDRGAWVHTVSKAVADDVIANLGADPQRVVTIHNGAPAPQDPSRIDRLVAEGRRQVGCDEYLAFIGTLEPRKDVPSLIDAFDRIAEDRPSLRLVIAGPDGWGADAVSSRIATSPHRSRIIRTGWLSADRRDALLAGAAAFVYPSLLEGFGLPPLEAMSLGTPVVATSVGSLPEVLGDAARWCTPGDPQSLAEAILAVIDDDGCSRRLADAGRAKVSDYSWERTADQLVDLFRRAASGR